MHSFTIRTYFHLPTASNKFNPITKMRALLVEMLKSKPSIVVLNLTNTTQLVLSKEQIPMNEDAFKKLFAISNDMRTTMTKQHIIIGCKLLSEQTMNEIKFDKAKPQLMEWLDKENVFIEADSLGIHRTTTIGYITKLHPQFTNRKNLKTLLQTALTGCHYCTGSCR